LTLLILHASPYSTLAAAGAINASFALPMKFLRKCPWENVWLVWSLFALLVFPIALACAAIPGFPRLYFAAELRVLPLLLIGGLWGVGQVLFGLALEAIGISLSTALMLGISTATGTLLPLALAGKQRPPLLHAFPLAAGVTLVIAGVVLCARAGQKRESGRSGALRGIVFAAAAGFGAGLFNLLLPFGRPFIQVALAAGSTPASAQLAAWTPFLCAGAVVNIGYCIFRLVRRKTACHFAERGAFPCWLGGMLMAALWLGSALLYGTAAGQMGAWGTVFAWPIYMSLIVLGTAVIGLLANEWRAASFGTIITLTGGLTVLVAAVFVISSVQRMA
jgi:L-rhamnose-H+ transport protein